MSFLKYILVTLAFSCFFCTSLATQQSSFDFKQHQISVGFFDKHVLPTDIPRPPSPIMWKSRHKADYGMTFLYEWNVFHTKKYFSVNFGTNFSWWSMQSQIQLAATFLIDLRFWLFHTNSFNPYITWSIAAPTLISRRIYSQANLGEHFLFQDFLGIGAQIGTRHVFDISLKLYHYSNGDLFSHNDGFDVPSVLSIGTVFN